MIEVTLKRLTKEGDGALQVIDVVGNEVNVSHRQKKIY